MNTNEDVMTNQDKPKRKFSVAYQATREKMKARRFAMQAVYQHLLTGDSFADIAQQVSEREQGKDYDEFFFSDVIEGIAEFGDNFKTQLTPFINRAVSQLDVIEQAILLVAAYELNSGSTPPKVTIDEAIVIAKEFGSDDSYKFINGVLDKLYKSLSEK